MRLVFSLDESALKTGLTLNPQCLPLLSIIVFENCM
uniref:Uncharacterized protein n=1 Tax=Anguilla anguilla TaxID=7936 RepID=A0A0E9S3E0_ANGAN